MFFTNIRSYVTLLDQITQIDPNQHINVMLHPK
jgi:hypothetical protein